MRMRLSNLNQDRGTAGTTVLLSLIVSLFVIGLLVMIFALMGSSLRTASFDATTVAVTNETVTGLVNSTGTSAVSGVSIAGFTSWAVSVVHNSSNGYILPVANYTANADGTIVNATTVVFAWPINVSYSYVYDAENTATRIINDTTNALSSSTDFFDLFIVIGSMVVLILLTVIIIVAIRNSGMMDAGGTA